MGAELYRILKTKRSVYLCIYLLLLPLMDLLMNVKMSFWDYWVHPEAYHNIGLASSNVYHPAFASFLSGASQGHISQMLYIWLLPLYILFLYSDIYIQEKKLGYANVLLTKKTRRKFLKDRFLTAFTFFTTVVFVSLLINFVLAILIFSRGTSFGGAEQYAEAMQILYKISLSHPYSAYFIYMSLFSILAGIYGVQCMSISLLFPAIKYAYPLCFFIWVIQIILPNSLTYAMQPFIEYGPERIIPALFLYVFCASIITVVAWKYKVNTDEI